MLNETDKIYNEFSERVKIDKTKQDKFIKEENISRELHNNHMMTSSFNFEGYNIVKYNGVISGEVVIGTGFLSEFSAGLSDFFGVESEKFSNKMENAKKIAMEKLVAKSIYKGDNAIIGVNYNYVTFSSSNMIGLSANGTSVKIEKI